MTTPTTTLPPVVVDVTVRVPLEAAFHAFTADFARWWPSTTHHVGATDPVDVVLEPRSGGRWFERASDGVECDWGRVVAWEPPGRLQLAWNLDGSWTFRPGSENASLVDVRFTALEPGVTRVVVEHSGFEAHAAGAPAVRGGVAGDGGWPGLGRRFVTYAEGSTKA